MTIGDDFNDYAKTMAPDQIMRELDALPARRAKMKVGASQRIALVPFEEINLQTGGNYVVKGLIPSEALTVIWGPPKCAKSFLASDIALHVALGWQWRDRKAKAGPVVYVAAEGAHGFRARPAAFRQVRMKDYRKQLPFYLVPVTLDLVGDAPELIGAISESLGDKQPVMVVLDTLNRTMRGSENSDEDMSDYIKAADAVRETFSCAVVLVHHCGVDGTRPRGHTSLSGAVDAQIAVKKNTGDVITATVELCKDGPEGETFASTLRVVEVGINDDRDPITSCVIEPADPPEPQDRMKLTAKMRRALELLHDLLFDEGQTPPSGRQYPQGARLIPIELWRQYLLKAGVLDGNSKNPRQPFKRLKDGLINRGKIGEWDGLIWTTSAEREE